MAVCHYSYGFLRCKNMNLNRNEVWTLHGVDLNVTDMEQIKRKLSWVRLGRTVLSIYYSGTFGWGLGQGGLWRLLYLLLVCMRAKSLPSWLWPTLCATLWTVAWQENPMDRGILRARILEWVAMPSSRGSSQPMGLTCIFCLLHFLHCRWILYLWATWEAPICLILEWKVS